MKTKEDLLQAYIDARSSFIHEFSGDFKTSLRQLYDNAKEYAHDLGIDFNIEYFDSYDIDAMNDYGEDVYIK